MEQAHTNNTAHSSFFRREYIYKGFERFWHWTQALLIVFLMITGFEIHGSFSLLGYEEAVLFHDIAAWALIILIIFTIFWHFATGEWKQYIPSAKFLKEQFKYYISGIFKGAPHPTKKTSYNKFNPLQRLTYLGLKLFIMPAQIITGILYMFYMYPKSIVQIGGLELVAVTHTLLAFMLITFLIVHLYLLTTNEHPSESVKAMITGWEEIEVEQEQLHKEHMRDAIDKSAAGYYRLDKNGIFIDVNKSWLSMYKYEKNEDIIGKHFSVSRSGEHVEILNSLIKRALNGEHIKGTKVQRQCTDGSVGFHTLSMNPTYDEKNEIVGAEGFILDITNEKNT